MNHSLQTRGAASAPHSRKAGFTLVELLVVIGIIALLMGILMPALSAAKAHANKIKCASNIRTLGQVALLYAGDNKSMLPRNYVPGDFRGFTGGSTKAYPSWIDLFARSNRVQLPLPIPADWIWTNAYDQATASTYARIQWYQCPASPNDAITVDFCINGWGDNMGAALQMSKLKHSGNKVLFIEASTNVLPDTYYDRDVWAPYQLPNAGPDGKWGTADDGNSTAGGNVGRFGFGGFSQKSRVLVDQRHKGQVNICYLDGHVAPKPYKTVVQADFDLQ